MKKLMSMILALVMALSLVACGDKGGSSDNGDGGSSKPEHTDTTTVAVGAVILARDDVAEDDVYKFVADIFDNAADLVTSHAKYGELSLEYGASITSVPYHPGAAKYFAEKGIDVAAVKDGAGTGASRNLRFVTGGESGTYYAFGSVIAQHATNNAGVNVVGLSGNGSQANVQELVDGTADFAFCQSDVMAYAYNGTNLFDTKVEGFSTVAALYMEQVQIVTTNPDIKTVADLAGKSVSIGAPGSGVYFNAIDVLGAYGLTESDIKPTYQSFGDSADALKNGQIDAAFIVAGAPTTAVTDLATTKDTYLVSLDDEHVAKLLETSDYYTKTVIAKDAEWNRLYKEYLGIDVPDDRQGVLQDSHWANGNIGYFPSYAIGSAYGAQYLQEMSKDLDVDAVVRSGDLTPINNWLEDRIWKHGCMKDPVALFESVCGKFDPACYVAYLEKKFTEVYGLS